MAFLGILSVPRSGTNHLMHNVLASDPSFRSLGEIFHSVAPDRATDRIAALFPSFAEFRVALFVDPAGTLRRIDGGEEGVVGYKVFPDHVEELPFRRMAEASAGFILLARNPLSVWVSHVIASDLGQWLGVKTEDRMVRWDADDFLDLAIRDLAYLEERGAWLRAAGIPVIELTYSEVARPDFDSAAFWARLRREMPGLGAAPGAGEAPGAAEASIVRQDGRAALDRIDNRADAERDLADWGLSALADGADPADRAGLLAELRRIRAARRGEPVEIADAPAAAADALPAPEGKPAPILPPEDGGAATFQPTSAKRPSRTAYHVLNTLARLSHPLSPRRATRLRRSAEKRSPYRFRAHGTASPQSWFERAFAPKGPVADPGRARRIFVSDYRLPHPELSAGDRATVGLLADLVALGFKVTFAATDLRDAPAQRRALEALGVQVITNANTLSAADYLKDHGAGFGAFYLIRVDVVEQLLPTVRSVAPDAPVIFHAPDLYFLREARAAELSGRAEDAALAARTRAREAAVMRAVDHIVLVSPAEVPYVAQIVPERRISVFPALYSPVAPTPPGFAARKNLFFLGGFKHTPNVDAVKWFVHHIWPRVRAAVPEAEFHILGAEAPEEVIALGALPGVRFVGFVPDLDPVLAGYRISVAPIRFGAGIKGKLGAAMGAGVASVTTTIGAEGMGIVDGTHALVRDSEAGFAEAVAALYGSEELWERVAAAGRRLIEDRFGDAANQAAFFRVLDAGGAVPVGLYADHCRAAARPLFAAAPEAGALDLSVIVPAQGHSERRQACLASIALALRGTGKTAEVIDADSAADAPAGAGFAAACNAALAAARGNTVIVLDPDYLVMPGALVDMAEVAEREPEAGLVGATVLAADGTIESAGGVVFSDGSSAPLRHGEPRRDGLAQIVHQVGTVPVGGFALRRAAVAPLASGTASVADAAGQFAERARDAGRPVLLAARAALAGAGGIAAPVVGLVPGTCPAGTAQEIAAAAAETVPPAAARARREAGKLNILYFTPFPSHPDNHGNQATMQAFGRRFQEMGHKVHFALLESGMYDADSLKAMQACWDSFSLLPNKKSLGADGQEIPFDGWYEEGLGEHVRLLCAARDIDVVFCSYIFQSKLLDYVPAHMLKVIDTHDKMGNRYDMLRANGRKLEFFSCSPEEEGAYLRRADVVVARRAEEADYFDEVTGRRSAIVIPHVEDPKFLERRFDRLDRIGTVASANRINLAFTADFLRAIEEVTGGTPPFEVAIAGQVSEMVGELKPADQALFQRPWVKALGFVPDIAAFYREVDLMVSPVTMGTGINVKTVQAMAFGMPLVSTSWGSKGIETGAPEHEHADLASLVRGIVALKDTPARLAALAEISRARYRAFHAESMAAMADMFARVKR